MIKLLYTHENRLIVSNIVNLLEQSNITLHLKNEYAGAAAGDIVPHETWLEVWVDETEFEQASLILKKVLTSSADPDWHCKQCNEPNPASFELCWQCNSLR